MTESTPSQITILAIDDEAAVLAQIASIAQAAGYSCHCAHDAQSAREAIEQATPDLIISDINLAGHSGVTVCEQIKQQSGHGEVPVMFLSAAQGPDIIRRAEAGRGTYYLRKPFDARVLMQIVEKARHVPHHLVQA
jgi:CheY-like chemotaxis protein